MTTAKLSKRFCVNLNFKTKLNTIRVDLETLFLLFPSCILSSAITTRTKLSRVSHANEELQKMARIGFYQVINQRGNL